MPSAVEREILQQLKMLNQKLGEVERALKLMEINAEMMRQSQLEAQQHLALIEQRCSKRTTHGDCVPVALPLTESFDDE
jgi:hypothetical protein